MQDQFSFITLLKSEPYLPIRSLCIFRPYLTQQLNWAHCRAQKEGISSVCKLGIEKAAWFNSVVNCLFSSSTALLMITHFWKVSTTKTSPRVHCRRDILSLWQGIQATFYLPSWQLATCVGRMELLTHLLYALTCP